jgi:MFS family permease
MAHNAGFDAIRGALSNRNYRHFCMGNVVSQFGTWIQRVAVGWLTWELTESPTWLGIIAFCDLFPTVIIAPLAGAVADRVDRLTGLRIFQILAMAQAAAIAGLVMTGMITIWWLMGLTLFLGMVMSFIQPLRLSLTPSLVPRESLSSAIGINSLIFNAARVGGPAVAGLIIFHWGVGPAFAVNAVSFLAFIVALSVLDLPDRKRGGAAKPVRNLPREITEGFSYTAAHPGIRRILIVLTVVALCGRPVTELLPGFAADVFGRGADGLAMLTSAMGVGAVVGGINIASRGGVSGMTRWVVTCVFFLAVALIAFAATSNIWLALPCMALAGFATVSVGVGEQTLLQNAVAGNVRGRVLSLYGMLARGMPALGALVMGGLSSWFGLRWPIVGGAVLCLVLYLWARPNVAAMAETLEGEPDAG